MINDFHEEYFATKIIGKGSFAKVYYGFRKGTEKFYAIKAFNKITLYGKDKEEGVLGLYNEVEIMRHMGHSDHIMNFYEIHETVGSIYLIVEYLSGNDLLSRVKKGKITENRVKKIMKCFIKDL